MGDHCDFVPLRNMLIRTHLQDLKEVTNNVHYENYRCRKLAGVAGGSTDKIPNKNPMAQIEEEKREHQNKMLKSENLKPDWQLLNRKKQHGHNLMVCQSRSLNVSALNLWMVQKKKKKKK